jgi:hypothetical protein
MKLSVERMFEGNDALGIGLCVGSVPGGSKPGVGGGKDQEYEQ